MTPEAPPTPEDTLDPLLAHVSSVEQEIAETQSMLDQAQQGGRSFGIDSYERQLRVKRMELATAKKRLAEAEFKAGRGKMYKAMMR